MIAAASLPIAVRSSGAAAAVSATIESPVEAADGMSLVEQEKRLLIHALQKASGNQTSGQRGSSQKPSAPRC